MATKELAASRRKMASHPGDGGIFRRGGEMILEVFCDIAEQRRLLREIREFKQCQRQRTVLWRLLNGKRQRFAAQTSFAFIK